MKYLQIIVAVVLTAGLVHIARTNLHRQPEQLKRTINGFTFEFETIPKAIEMSDISIPIKLSGPMETGFRLVFRQQKARQNADTELRLFGTRNCLLKDSTTGEYETSIIASTRGRQLPYYFEVRDGTGGLRASFMQEEGVPFLTKFIGDIPVWIIVGHATLICLMIFCIAMGSIKAVALISGGHQNQPTAFWFALAAGATFVGGYLFGAQINSYTTGIFWGGVPFGTGIIENKTQLVFILLILTSLLFGFSLRKGSSGKGMFSPNVLGWIGLSVFPVTAFVLLIPNSIELSDILVKIIVYGFAAGSAGLFFARRYQLSAQLAQATGSKKTGTRNRRRSKK